MIDTGAGRHTYQAIAWEIRTRIETGQLKPGDRVPSLPQLQETKNVSNQTAQAAIRLLKAWQLVESRAGSGTFVRARRPVVHVMTEMSVPGESGRRRTWKEIVAEQGMTGGQRPVGAGTSAPPVEITDALGLDPSTPVTWRRRLLLVDDSPVQISTSYYPPEIAAALPELGQPGRLSTNSPELLARAGWSASRGEDRDVARFATEDEVGMLELPEQTPVLETLRLHKTSSGEVVTAEVMVSDSTRLHIIRKFAA